MNMLRPLAIGLVSLSAVVFAAPVARAQSADNSATVEALFDEGKRLMAAGKVAEACPKFLASYELEHRVGTLLNLAACYEQNAQLASAWARFVEARTLAARNNQPERQQFADDHAKALEPKLSKLTVTVTRPVPGLEVKVDGQAVAQGAWGVAVPMDAGKHTVQATAPDHVAFSGEVTLGAGADQQTLAVPELAAAPRPVTGPAPETPQPQSQASGGLGGRKILALAVAGVGVVGLGIGSYFGVTALGKNSSANSSPDCNQGGVAANCIRGSTGAQERNDAYSDANLSTIFLGAGAAFVVGGAVLWLTAPSAPSATPSASVGFDGRMLRVSGTF